jgi:DNA-binding beta-propeller fold protein YncE
MFRCRSMVVTAASLVLILVPFRSAFAQSVFWANEWYGIYRTNADGSNAAQVYSTDGTGATAQGIAVANDGTIYWTDYRTNSIWRTNSDASGTTAVVSCDSEPRGIAIDGASGKMYWAQFGGGYSSIDCANLDGTGVTKLVTDSSGSGSPIGIALDPVSKKIYWADRDGNQIWQAGLDGTNAKPVVTGVSGPFMLALDTVHDKIYISSQMTGTVLSANYDGSGLQDVVTGLGRPRGIALDLDGGKMYIADYGARSILSANLDGSDLTTIVTGAGLASGIALGVPEPSTLVLLGIGAISLLAYAWQQKLTGDGA